MKCDFRDSDLKNIPLNYSLSRGISGGEFPVSKWQLVHVEPCALMKTDLYFAVVIYIKDKKVYTKLISNERCPFKITGMSFKPYSDQPYDWGAEYLLDLANSESEITTEFETDIDFQIDSSDENSEIRRITVGDKGDVCIRYTNEAEQLLKSKSAFKEEAFKLQKDGTYTIMAGNRICRFVFTP